MKVDIDITTEKYSHAWTGFSGEEWQNEINVRDFIQHNYTPYEGDGSFLVGATAVTTVAWRCTALHTWCVSVNYNLPIYRHHLNVGKILKR